MPELKSQSLSTQRLDFNGISILAFCGASLYSDVLFLNLQRCNRVLILLLLFVLAAMTIFFFAEMEGRIFFDLQRIIQASHPLRTYSLQEVSETINGSCLCADETVTISYQRAFYFLLFRFCFPFYSQCAFEFLHKAEEYLDDNTLNELLKASNHSNGMQTAFERSAFV